MDCIWKDSCQRLERINIPDKRDAPGHPKDIFEIIVVSCSLKNCDRSYDGRKEKETGMYYCTECQQMHHEWSSIGKSHKRIISRIP